MGDQWFEVQRSISSAPCGKKIADRSPLYSDLFAWNVNPWRMRLRSIPVYLLYFATFGVTKLQGEEIRLILLKRLDVVLRNQSINKKNLESFQLFKKLVLDWPRFKELFEVLLESDPFALFGNWLPQVKRIQIGYTELPKKSTTRIKRPQRKRGYNDHGTYVFPHKRLPKESDLESFEPTIYPSETRLEFLEDMWPELNTHALEVQNRNLQREIENPTCWRPARRKPKLIFTHKERYSREETLPEENQDQPLEEANETVQDNYVEGVEVDFEASNRFVEDEVPPLDLF